MNALAEFFSPEAGQRRRNWLSGQEERVGNALRYYLGPDLFPPVNALANGAAMISPGADVQDAYTASGELMAPGRSALDRAGSGAALAASIGAMIMPGGVSSLRQGFDDVVDAGVRAYDPNTVNIFAGPRAATADAGALTRAQDMAEAGASRDEIWDQTGWFRGVDGKWRFEIDDRSISLRTPQEAAAIGDKMESDARDITNGINARNAELRTQPDLFPADLRRLHGDLRRDAASLKREAGSNFGPSWNHSTLGQRAQYAVSGPLAEAYPSAMRDTIVRTQAPSPNFLGSYNGQQNRLEVTRLADDERSTLLHELQHMVQGEEGFARGSNPSEGMAIARDRVSGAGMQVYDEMKRLADNLPEEEAAAFARFEQDPDAPFAKEAFGLISPRTRKIVNMWDQSDRLARSGGNLSGANAMAFYRRSAGETEARNVQTRRDFTPEQRRATPPWATHDVPEAAQIVRFGNSVSDTPAQNIANLNAGVAEAQPPLPPELSFLEGIVR